MAIAYSPLALGVAVQDERLSFMSLPIHHFSTRPKSSCIGKESTAQCMDLNNSFSQMS
ncbi:hypothetical protein K1T71_008890 [Dendrolimus kikuchii]|uniref:Uncharacterized protein n=1 Tax=Dendrolimus kikuchii TaxID=765133 RepID=A0ACC1CVW4_9NEOP|nr:hypothetical protein K1T71_008890 [Dendrolimus kikuchii]